MSWLTSLLITGAVFISENEMPAEHFLFVCRIFFAKVFNLIGTCSEQTAYQVTRVF